MRRRTKMRVWLAVFLFVGGILLGACGGATPVADTPAATTEAVTEETPAIDAAALLEERCVDCHGLNRVTEARYTQEEWQSLDRSGRFYQTLMAETRWVYTKDGRRPVRGVHQDAGRSGAGPAGH